ncbi:hypothetical protein HID58_018824 [Brassica napus]|uniref:Uncharacterized protein n=1 Tax=Brassica napus TaxID=3708 RepID=A0ABQ8DBI4_BRANA|nr:hypothetical protein HID58_018824 [Brassica napus]
MNSRQVLRVIHGPWNLHQNGEWSFERKTNNLGFPAFVRTLENFDSLERIIRSLYNLAIETPISMTYRLPEWMLIPDCNKTPPITIRETHDVQVMMAVRAWFADLTLCVTIGAEDVAHYQFFYRDDFNIGSSSYKFENGNEDPSFEGFLGEAVIESHAVLEVYFNDQKMMVIHRVHLEMEKEKLDLENQRFYKLVHGNEIIVIDYTDSDSDGTEPLGSNKLSITMFNTGASSNKESLSQQMDSSFRTRETVNTKYNSPMEYYEGIPVQFTVDEDLVIVQPSSPVIDDVIRVIASENDNHVKDEEHSDEMDLYIPMSQNISQLQQNGTTNVDDANSSNDSTPDLDEVNNVVLSWENVSENLSNTQPIYDNPVVSEGVLDDTLVI